MAAAWGLQHAPHLLLGAVLGAFVWAGCCGSSPHSLYIFYTLFTDSSQDGAQYIVVVYVDDQLAARFDPTTKRMLPQVAWLHNVKEEDSYFWKTTSRIVNSLEPMFRNDPRVLHIYNNFSRGSWAPFVLSPRFLILIVGGEVVQIYMNTWKIIVCYTIVLEEEY